MQEAILEAKKAYNEEEVPIGAVIILNDQIIARAHNRVRNLKDPTAHAELLAIKEAARVLNSERLLGTSLYVTIEPCPMCLGAAIWARIEELIYGAPDPKAGACGSLVDLMNSNFNHRPRIIKDILKDESLSLLQKFFLERR
ncbi:TPA: tRNA-specific adenosine deaminase [bacterium]|nr:tRNA-specific adenosine deaminase [bacterium]